MSLIILFQPKGLIDAVLTAHGQVAGRYKAVIGAQVIEFLLYCSLIPLFGLWGAVAATILTEVGGSITLYVVYKWSYVS
jgi:O-antigen/teichoic acid export membrane protein